MVSAQETISVVIPSWRGCAHLEALLPGISAQTLRPLEVLIVDGNSTDGTAELAAQSGARLINLGQNLGFAVAVNRGVNEAKASRIAVLNNDLRLAPDWLEKLAAADAPFAVGKVLDWERPEFVDATWDLLSQSGIPMRSGQGKRDGAYWNHPREIALAPWTAILLGRDYWEATGGLDEKFESYLEDIDIGMRGWKLGFRGRFEPGAVAWHRGSSTLGAWHPRQVRLSSRNQVRLLAKHGCANWWKAIVGQGLWGIAAARHGCLSDWLSGKWEGVRSFSEAATEADAGAIATLEEELFAVSAATGMDRFWRLYWTLT